ncbi:MAG: TolC family protein [Planctomycetota bacterium]
MRRRFHHIGLGSVAAAVLLSVAACGPDPLSRLDREAADILERQRDRSLGVAAADVAVTPPTPVADPRPGDYKRQPATDNPAADALTIAPAPPRDRVPDPVVLDDGTQPDTLRLDLEGLIGRAIETAPDYRRQREDLFLTTLSLIVERHEWGPRFFSAVTGRIDGVPEAGDNETALNLIASLGVTQRLPYGGSVSATALVDYVRLLERASTSTLPTETDATELQFALDLPLLRGAGRSAATVESRIQAERDLVYAVRDFERFRRTFFVDIATRYFDLLRRQRQLQNQELQLRNFQNSAALFSALAEAGRAPFFRAQRAEQRVLRARNSLLNQQEGYVRQLDALKLEVGIDPNRPVEILAVEIDVPEVLLDLDASVETALRQRLDLQTVGDTVQDARRGVQIARNGLLPDLDLDADVTVATDATLQRGGLDFELGDSAYDVGLTLGLPLDRKIEYTDFRAALIRLERQRRDFTVERDRVSLEVRRAVRAIDQARFVLQLQERAVEINEKRAEQIQIDQRSLGPNEVIDVQEDLLDARNDRDEAASDLRISILEYLLATGQMRIGPDGRWRAPASLRPVEVPGEPPTG